MTGQITGQLLGIIKIGEPACGHDKRGCQCNTDAFDGGEQVHLFPVLALRQGSDILFHCLDLLLEESNRLFDGFLAFRVKRRKNSIEPLRLRVATSCFFSWRSTVRFCFSTRIESLRSYKDPAASSPRTAIRRASISSVLVTESMARAKFFIFSGFSRLTVIPASESR